jgi:hypothetical protein
MGAFRWLIILLMLTVVYAVEELPISIKGNSLVYHEDEVVARGQASIAYGGYEINADAITINTKTNLIIGDGHVLIGQTDKTLPAESFVYDITTEQLEINAVKYSFRPAVAKQDIFLSFDQGFNLHVTNNSEDILKGTSGRLTTCDLDAPHYWVKAKQFLYYPNDKIVAYHMTMHFWFSPLPMMYSPYYVFGLGKRNVVFMFPKIGSNTVEGNFIKTETRYFIDDFNEGSVFVDAMQTKGNGKGWYHSYNFGDPGAIYYYTVDEQDMRHPRRDTKIIKWHQEYSPSIYDKFTINHRYRKTYLLPLGFEDKSDEDFAYDYRDGSDTAKLNYSLASDYQYFTENQSFASNVHMGSQTNTTAWQKNYRQNDQYRYEAFNMTQVWQVNPEWQYRINPAYSRTKVRSNPFDERMDLAMDLDLTPQEKKYFQSMSVHSNWSYDMDRDMVTADNNTSEFLEKMPEVTVKGIRQNIGAVTENEAWFSVDSTYTTGLIREAKYFAAYDRRRVFQATKYSVEWTPFKTYDLGLATMTLARTYKQTGYSTYDAHYMLSDRPLLVSDWWGWYRNRLEYEDTRGKGNSPFFYDDPVVTDTKHGRHTMTFYQRSMLVANVSSGKEYKTNLFDDYLYDLTCDPWEDGKIKFTAASGENYYTHVYQDLVIGTTVHPWERHYYRLSVAKDMNKNFDENMYAGKMKSASSEADFSFGRTYEEMKYWSFWESEWHFIVKNTYDFNTEYYNLQSFSLGKDLHCWYMRYNMTPVRKEWWVVFTLKAFPGEPLNVHGNEDKDFSFEAFSDELNSGAVRRYE